MVDSYELDNILHFILLIRPFLINKMAVSWCRHVNPKTCFLLNVKSLWIMDELRKWGFYACTSSLSLL